MVKKYILFKICKKKNKKASVVLIRSFVVVV